MARVAELLGEWAREREESPGEEARWIAVGFLHDALRDESREKLRDEVDPLFRDLPGKVLHGPGSAWHLRNEGVEDQEFLHAIVYHTLGSPDFGTLGFALYAADFLEPGREIREDWRAELRVKAPTNLESVVKEILAARIGYLLEKGRPLHPHTLALWNRLSEGQPWASASES
jgi:HD superfamily phosphohydrolase YqeK